MKKTHLLYIVCLLLSGSLLLNGLAQDFAAQWHLPEGAKARLGRGKLIIDFTIRNRTYAASIFSIGDLSC